MAGATVVLFFSFSSFAQSGPRLINISGGLFYPNGSPILTNNVTFKIEIRDKAGSCVLYSELHNAQDLSQTKGAFSLLLGAGSSRQNFISSTGTLDAAVFKNPGVIAPFTGCASGLTFAAGDERVIRVYYDTGAGLTAMTPDVPVVASAYAMVAETLQGKSADEFVTVQGTAAGNLNQANLEYSYSLTNWQRLKDLIDGVSSSYLPTAGTGTFNFGNRIITGVAAPGTSAMDAVNKGYADAYIGGKATDLTSVGAGFGGGQAIVWDQAQNKWVTGSATDASKLPLAGGTMSGDITMAGNDLFAVGDVILNVQKKLQLGRFTDAEETALIATLGTAHTGMTWYNTTDLAVKVWNGTAVTRELTVSDTGTSTLDSALIPATGVTAGTYGSPSTVPVFTVGADGRLTVAYGTAISGVAPGGAAGGDLTGTYPNPSIAAAAVTTAKLGDNAVTAAKIKSSGVAINRLIATDPVTPNNLTYFECPTPNDIIAWTASGWACTTVSALSPVKTVASKTPDAAGNVALSAYDITGIESAATKDYGTAAGDLVELDGTGRIPASLLPGMLSWPLLASPGVTSAGAPSYAFSGDTDTGMYSPGAGTATFATNGTARLTIDSVGFVGIGTTAPTVPLHVIGNALFTGGVTVSGLATNGDIATGNGAVGTPGFRFFNDADTGFFLTANNSDTLGVTTGGVERMRVNAAGLVAIGGTTPAAILDVSATGTNSAIVVPRDTTANRPAGNVLNGMVRYNTNTNAFEGYVNGNWQNFAVGAGVGTVQNISTGTGLLGGPINSTGTISADVGTGANQLVQLNASGQSALHPGAVGTPAYSFNGDTDTGLFSSGAGTASFATNGTSRLTIDSTGSVGIGTTTPTNGVLEVSRNQDAQTRLWVANYNAGSAARGILFIDSDAAGVELTAHSSATAVSDFRRPAGVTLATRAGATGGLSLAARNAASGVISFHSGGDTEHARLDQNGNFGLGTTAPKAILDVAATGTNSAIIVPRDTTANRPAGNVLNGMVRYNTNTNAFEGYVNGLWQNFAVGTGVGTVQSITAGTGLTGGPINSVGTLAVDVGIAANKIPQLNANAQFALGYGSTALPTYSFAGQTNSGMYMGAAGIEVAVDGTARLKVLATETQVSRDLTIGDEYVADTTLYFQHNFGNQRTAKITKTWAAPYDWNFFSSMSSATRNDYNFYLDNGASTPVMTLNKSYLVGINSTAPLAVLDVNATGTNSAVIVPRSTTASRPGGNATNGMIRYNTNTNKFEAYENGAWANMIGIPNGSTGLFANGSAGAPSVSFTGDTDTGMYMSAAGNLNFATNGTSRFHIDDRGYAAFGTSPTNYLFDVSGFPEAVGATGAGIRLSAQAVSSGSFAGGPVTISSGWGNGNANGGNIAITAGQAGSTGTGGAISLTSGAAGGTGAGGAINLTSGNGLGGWVGAKGGAINLTAGNSAPISSPATGGDINLTAGSASTSGSSSASGGAVTLKGGRGALTSGQGGGVNLIAGNGGSTAGAGGVVTISAGTATGGSAAGYIALMNGNVGVGTTTTQATLDVNGSIRMAADATACSSTNAGAMRYSGSVFQACDGVNWINMGGMVGSIRMAGASNCDWITNSATYVSMNTNDTDCSAATVTGSALAPTEGNIPGIRFANLAPGDYELVVNVSTWADTSTSCRFRIYDGTTGSGVGAADGGPGFSTLIGRFNYGSAQASTTFYVQVLRESGGGNCHIYNDETSMQFEAWLKKM